MNLQKRKVPNNRFWENKKVLITGHTGFKGSWLSLWLLQMGCDVIGIALEPENEKNLFDLLNLKDQIKHNICDIRNKKAFGEIIKKHKPDIIFHLAAQPLVITSYKKPLETWQINVMGTVNLLDEISYLDKKCSVVFITTDKVYENNEWTYGYREIDKLGGLDPYSSSKAACEIAIHSWRESFYSSNQYQKTNFSIASARAGNVIGGGDWSENRIVPDVIRSLEKNNAIYIRNPSSTRPWQHVLEPLSGYILLAEKLYSDENDIFCSPFNFGPELEANKSVLELVQECLKYWEGDYTIQNNNDKLHEAGKLNLVIDKAHNILDWKPRWDFCKTIDITVNWYKNFTLKKKSPLESCLNDLSLYIDSK